MVNSCPSCGGRGRIDVPDPCERQDWVECGDCYDQRHTLVLTPIVMADVCEKLADDIDAPYIISKRGKVQIGDYPEIGFEGEKIKLGLKALAKILRERAKEE